MATEHIGALPVYDLGAIYAGTANERDREIWRASEDVLKHLDPHYLRPPEITMPSKLRNVRSPDQLKQLIASEAGFATSFGAYRYSVMRYEETAARRLDVLRGTASSLLKLREKVGAERCDAMLQHLSDFVSRTWGMDLNLDGDRHWALKAAMRFDLLPPAWRYV